jgi:hypothetical protein
MKGQDILAMLKLTGAEPGWTYKTLASSLGVSASETHAAIKRCEESGLYNSLDRKPNRGALHEFLVHGIRYVFPTRMGPIGPGLPTSFAASPLREKLNFNELEAPVMPWFDGPARGPQIEPLYPSAPKAASQDPALHQLLALVDALRTGRVRERKLAGEHLAELLKL